MWNGKEVQTRERFFLYTSLFRAGVEWLTSVIASVAYSSILWDGLFIIPRDKTDHACCLFIHPSGWLSHPSYGMAYSSFQIKPITPVAYSSIPHCCLFIHPSGWLSHPSYGMAYSSFPEITDVITDVSHSTPALNNDVYKKNRSLV